MEMKQNRSHTMPVWIRICIMLFCIILAGQIGMRGAWATEISVSDPVQGLEDAEADPVQGLEDAGADLMQDAEDTEMDPMQNTEETAASAAQKVFDQAGLFTQSQREALEERAVQFLADKQYDVAIVTTNSTGSMVTYEYAEFFYQAYHIGYGNDLRGFLLLIDMDNRQVYIDEYNALEKNFQLSTRERDAILDVIMEYAYDGDFYGVADSFLDCLPQYLNNGISGDADYHYALEHGEPGENRTVTFSEAVTENAPVAALIALGIAAITLIILIVMQKTGSGASAAEYQKGGLNVYRRSDVFVNTTVTKHKIETSSGGGGGGGGGGSSHHGGGHSGGGRSF